MLLFDDFATFLLGADCDLLKKVFCLVTFFLAQKFLPLPGSDGGGDGADSVASAWSPFPFSVSLPFHRRQQFPVLF